MLIVGGASLLLLIESINVFRLADLILAEWSDHCVLISRVWHDIIPPADTLGYSEHMDRYTMLLIYVYSVHVKVLGSVYCRCGGGVECI